MDDYTRKIKQFEKCYDTLFRMLGGCDIDLQKYANITQTLINIQDEIRRLKIQRKYCLREDELWNDGGLI
jgi:hypothetical protein